MSVLSTVVVAGAAAVVAGAATEVAGGADVVIDAALVVILDVEREIPLVRSSSSR